MPISSGDEVATSRGKKKTSFWSEEEKREEHDGAEDWERHESFNNDVGTQVSYKTTLLIFYVLELLHCFWL